MLLAGLFLFKSTTDKLTAILLFQISMYKTNCFHFVQFGIFLRCLILLHTKSPQVNWQVTHREQWREEESKNADGRGLIWALCNSSCNRPSFFLFESHTENPAHISYTGCFWVRYVREDCEKIKRLWNQICRVHCGFAWHGGAESWECETAVTNRAAELKVTGSNPWPQTICMETECHQKSLL